VGSDGINRNEDDRNHLVLCCFLEYSEETFPARPLSDPKTSLSLFESSYIYPPLEPDQSSWGKTPLSDRSRRLWADAIARITPYHAIWI